MQLDDSTMGRGAPLGNSIAISGAYGFGMSIDHSKTAHSASADIIYDFLYAEYRDETLYAPEWTRYRSVRLGFLKRRWRSIAVGVIVGRRTVRGALTENGVEVALPFISRGDSYLLHIETAYVATDHHVSWNWRFDGEFSVKATPAFLGFSTGLQTLPLRRHGQLSSGTVMLKAGIRHRFGTNRSDP